MIVKQDNIKNPGNRYRPLKIMHGINFSDAAAYTMTDKKKAIDAQLDAICEKGYGGIVTNVDFSEYLESEENWELLVYLVKQAFYRKMRVWIYDEKGYPSGAAGGITLRDHPEYEAKALSCVVKNVKANETVCIKKPYGHDELITAYALPLASGADALKPANKLFYSKEEDLFVDHATGAPIDLDKYTSADGTVEWTAHTDSTVFYMVTKRLYEGTHAQHNTFSSRRYISVLNKAAVSAFIDNTYKAYEEKLGDYFGDEIEAFFTDEPSLMPAYINEGLYPKQIDDEFDENIELLPIVAWEDNILDEYQRRYGADLRMSLHYLFMGTTGKALRIRYNFYQMLSDMYEDAFFCQIGDFCSRTGINFSGHVLLEENLLHHPVFEGNIFRFMRHMGVPGIDMLTTVPHNVLAQAATPKLVASSANWHAKPHVMSEVSGHMEGATKHHFTVREMIGSICVQFALGVDTFTSYYSDTYVTDEDFHLFCDTTARLGELLRGGTSMAHILLYYPIDSAWVATKGSDKQLGEREYGEGAVACEQSWVKLISLILKNKFQFDCVDNEALSSVDVSAENGCIINRVTGQKYDIVVVPRLLTLTDRMITDLRRFADAGVMVMFDSLSTNVFVPEIESAHDRNNKLADMLLSNNIINCAGAEDIVKMLKTVSLPYVEIVNDTDDVIVMGKYDTCSGFDTAYLFVNCGANAKVCDALIDTKIIHRRGSRPTRFVYCNPSDGVFCKLPYRYNSDGRIQVELKIDAFSAVVVGFGKAEG